MKSNKIKSFAKVNLCLNVTGKTQLLHKIETVVAFVDLYDEISIESINSKKHKILFIGKFSKNIYKNNTISKLLQILEKKKLLKDKKFKILINKKIPHQSGLGGGSMNAANILLFLVKKKIIKTSKKELLYIANKVGSDVKLGLNSTYSILTSKNKISHFRNCKRIHTLIIKPDFGCSTKYVFSKVERFNKPKLNNPNKNMFSLNFLKKMENVLEPIVFSKYPKLRLIKAYLENLPKINFVRMTGSGSAIVAYFQSKESCIITKKKIMKKYKNCWCMVSKTI
tara:strand:+ start:1760 stop:2605 length:846 start_codon:yes stop_codon:yes gene_type:complete